MTSPPESVLGPLRAAGLPEQEMREWSESFPVMTGDYGPDARDCSAFWRRSAVLLRKLPPKPRRNEAEQTAADALMSDGRTSRELFLAAHVEQVYDLLTQRCSTFRRIDELVYAAAPLAPGLVPTQKEVRATAAHPQRDKDGVEIDQGLFLAHVLARPRIGEHLCHAMLLPRPEIAALLAEFASRGSLNLGAARLTRKGKAVHLDTVNPRFLNTEDDTTLAETELAVDVATLDRTTEIAVMRGAPVDNEKYRGKRIFGAGINLTHLYLGKIPYLWFMIRDLGYVHKLIRGVAMPESVPDDVKGRGVEKLWVAGVDTFAIGGHCQTLLCMDYILAASDAFLSLPARKEGIIPAFRICACRASSAIAWRGKRSSTSANSSARARTGASSATRSRPPPKWTLRSTASSRGSPAPAPSARSATVAPSGLVRSRSISFGATPLFTRESRPIVTSARR